MKISLFLYKQNFKDKLGYRKMFLKARLNISSCYTISL